MSRTDHQYLSPMFDNNSQPLRSKVYGWWSHTHLFTESIGYLDWVSFLLDHAKEVKAMLSCSHGILLAHTLSSLSGYPKSLYKGMVVQWCPQADFDSNFHEDSNLKFLSQMPSRQNFHQKQWGSGSNARANNVIVACFFVIFWALLQGSRAVITTGPN